MARGPRDTQAVGVGIPGGNLERLIDLLDPRDDRQRLKQAEALRELGQFVSAESLLLQHYPKDRQTFVQFMLDLTRGRIRELRKAPWSA